MNQSEASKLTFTLTSSINDLDWWPIARNFNEWVITILTSRSQERNLQYCSMRSSPFQKNLRLLHHIKDV